MTTLILKDEEIVAAVRLVEETPAGYISPDGVFPFAAGVTGTTTVDSLPADFRSDRYVWRDGALERLPDPDPPPMTAEQARAALAITDGQFEPRWIEDIAAGTEMPARYTAWVQRRATLRAIVNGG
jgi:hypothetical protein